MKLKEITHQLHSLSNGKINGEQFSRKELETVFEMWMRTSNRYIGSITLPDGEWLFSLERYGNEYGYFIPETRDAEKNLYGQLGIE